MITDRESAGIIIDGWFIILHWTDGMGSLGKQTSPPPRPSPLKGEGESV